MAEILNYNFPKQFYEIHILLWLIWGLRDILFQKIKSKF